VFGSAGFGQSIPGSQLAPHHDHVARGIDTEANLTALDTHDGDTDVIPDVDLLQQLPREHEH
jgi:hypothetical protein